MRKDIFEILKLVVYSIYVNISLIYPVEHSITMSFKADGAVSMFLKLRMRAVFQTSGHSRKKISGFQCVLPYIAGGLFIQKSDLPV